MAETLQSIAQSMVAQGRGILAADESSGNIKIKFEKLGIEDSPETHRQYRELLFSSPEIEKYISGVILFDETLRQATSDGVPFVEYLSKKGIIPGIKVDVGLKDFEDHPGEQITKWDDSLSERLKEYNELGARFAKWRTVFWIGEKIPSQDCVENNAVALAKYAKLCQQNNIVPIVEPEVLMDGNHTIERCFEVTKQAHDALFLKLQEFGVDLTGIVLKPNMVVYSLSGKREESQKVAELTVDCFSISVPKEVPGIVFLSGGQSEQEACENLNEIVKQAEQKTSPWKFSFSFGRALQNSAMKTWAGKQENINEAQAVFIKRCRLASLAAKGEYDANLE